jgi:hypothetical protein
MFHGLTLPYPYVYAPGAPWTVLCLYIAGAALCLYGGLMLAQYILSRNSPTLRFLAPLARPESAGGLGNGVLLGVGSGLLGSIAFGFVQSHVGDLLFLSPNSLVSGLPVGAGLGVLAGALAGRLPRCPRSVVFGLGAGVAAGFVALRLRFGPTAGEGDEAELALVFGLLGGLLGAFLATILAGAIGRQARWWRRILLGAGSGLTAGLALALLGTLSGQVMFTLPEANQATTAGLVYGFGVYAAAGALLGGVAGGLAPQRWHTETEDEALASPVRSPSWLVFALGLLLGLQGGLAIGLTYSCVGGGPLSCTSVPPDPQAGLLGLLVGGLLGLLLGIGLAVLWNRADRQRSDRVGASRRKNINVGASIALIAIGLVVLSLSYWFIPLLAIPCYSCF